MATRNDVAVKAGVSPSTVTRALNDHPSISQKTVARVKKAALELDYVPSRLGRGHFQQKSFQIGLVIPFKESDGRIQSVPEEYFTRCLYGMAREARKQDYSLSVITDSGLSALDLEKEVRSRRVDGLIFLGTHRGDERFLQLYEKGIPLVLVHNRGESAPIPFVDTDSYPGLKELFDLLKKRRIKEIGLLNGGEHFFNAVERKKIIENLSHEYSIQIIQSQEGFFSRRGGRLAASQFLEGGLPPVILSANDRMAYGLVEGLKAEGIRIGKDVGIVGFDNLQIATLLNPGLTTIHNPFYRVGQGAAELLINQLNGEKADNIIYPTNLVIRDSFH
jgi:LacI family transcriptional regulator